MLALHDPLGHPVPAFHLKFFCFNGLQPLFPRDSSARSISPVLKRLRTLRTNRTRENHSNPFSFMRFGTLAKTMGDVPLARTFPPPTLHLSPLFLILTRNRGRGVPGRPLGQYRRLSRRFGRAAARRCLSLGRDPQNQRLVRRHLRGKLPGELPEVLRSPQVADSGGNMFRVTKFGPIQGNVRFRGAAIEKDHRAAPVLQLLHPNLLVPVLANAAPLRPKRVLIDRDHFLVRKNRLNLRRHRPQVVPRNQRRRQHCPQTEVRAVFERRHSAVPHFQHVRIVPMSRPSRAFQPHLHIHNVQHAKRAAAAIRPLLFSFPVVVDVARRSPQISRVPGPLPRFCRSPFAHAKNDRPACGGKRIMHRRVSFLRVARVGAAPVVLQIVHAPARVLYRVLEFVALAAGPFRASQFSGVRIQSEFQSLRMNVICKRFNAGRESLWVGQNKSIFVAAHLPAIVDHNVLIAGVFHSACHHRVCHRLDHLFADVAAEFIPTVPAHWRSERDAVVPRARGGRKRDEKNQSKHKRKYNFRDERWFHGGLRSDSARNHTGFCANGEAQLPPRRIYLTRRIRIAPSRKSTADTPNAASTLNALHNAPTRRLEPKSPSAFTAASVPKAIPCCSLGAHPAATASSSASFEPSNVPASGKITASKTSDWVPVQRRRAVRTAMP